MSRLFSLTPTYSHCYELDKQGRRVAHRVIVFRNWARITFVSIDGYQWEPRLGGQVLSSAGLMQILGYAKEEDLDEIAVGLRNAMQMVEPIDFWGREIDLGNVVGLSLPKNRNSEDIQSKWDTRRLTRATPQAAASAKVGRL